MEKQQESSSSTSTPSQPQEFSFTVCLHSNTPTAAAAASPHRRTSSSPSSGNHPISSSSSSATAIDLSPADEIFFHGHLLPLHLLSHFSLLPSSSSARSSFSTDDDDTFTLPSDHHYSPSATANTSVGEKMNTEGPQQKFKAFSMFGLSRRRRVVHGVVADDEETGRQKRRSSKFEVSSAVKRCMRMMMSPRFLFRRRRRRRDIEFSLDENDSSSRYTSRRSFKLPERRQTSSYYSAPTSGMTSPTNSGLLVGRPVFPAGGSSSSTVEELQAAIQAAIAYCKRSIEVEKDEDEK